MIHSKYFLFAMLFVSPLTLCMQPIDDAPPAEVAPTESETLHFRWEKIDDVPREERDQPGWVLFSREGWEQHVQEQRLWKNLARERAAREEAEHEDEVRLMGEFAHLQHAANRRRDDALDALIEGAGKEGLKITEKGKIK